jgi:hypothetical protein
MRAFCVATAALAFFASGAAEADAACAPVLSHYDDPGTVTASTMACAPGGSAIHGGATFGTQPGDLWHGTSSYDYCLYPTSTPGAYTYAGTETLTGWIKGCGYGAFTWIGAGTFSQDSASPGGGTWQVIPGSGTGALRTARGGGTDTAFVGATLANYGEFDGILHC